MAGSLPPSKARRRGGRLVVPDGCPLSPQEYAVMRLLIAGKVRKEIALELGIKPTTVRTQTHTGYRRLGVTSATQAVARCIREGWFELSPKDVRLQGLTPSEPPRLTPVQSLYVRTWMRYIREAPADEVLPMLMRLVRGEGDNGR